MPALLQAILHARPRAAAVVALALLAVACQEGANPFAIKPSPTPTPLRGLAAADQKFLTGDYDAAESDYVKLINEKTRDAHAHYSLLLAYENRFRDAVAQAQAGVSTDGDSASWARLTRAYDWTDDIPSALASGERATTASHPVTLAHVFYAEALSDSGQADAARAQLNAAAAMHPSDAYTRSEIDREWANYYRDAGALAQETLYFQKSYEQEPRFPERSLELTRFYYGEGHDPEKARATLERIRSSQAHHYSVLVAAALVASLAPDNDTAISFFQNALKLEPNGVDAALGLAQIQVAVKRDFRGAHDVLLSSLRAHPADADVYLYLRYLDALVLKRDPDKDLGAQPASAAARLAGERRAALAKVNSYRAGVHLAALSEDSSIDQGAEAHAYYFLFNYGSSSESGLGVHHEQSNLPGFTGENGLLRARHFGFQGYRGAEVINHVFSPGAAVQVWVDSVFHRFPILDPETQSAGYGEAQIGPLAIQVMDMGMGDASNHGAIAFPSANQSKVPSSFLGNEVPNPLPANVDQPVGYPVTLQFGGADVLTVTSSRLVGPGGEVPSYILNPGTGSMAQSEWSLLAKQPLQAGTTYTAEVVGRLNGAPFSMRWSFTVAGATGTLQ